MKITIKMFVLMMALTGIAEAKITRDTQKGMSCNPGTAIPKNSCTPAPAAGEVCCEVITRSAVTFSQPLINTSISGTKTLIK
jgi:hypothetical protein